MYHLCDFLVEGHCPTDDSTLVETKSNDTADFLI